MYKNAYGLEINLKNLSEKGMSMTQAQSLSNLCNQHSQTIENELAKIGNFSSKLEHNGKDYPVFVSQPVPADIAKKLKEQGEISALQGILMENIKTKSEILEMIRRYDFEFDTPPAIPNYRENVSETDMKSYLSITDFGEFIYHEAMAAKIGQFIHKNGTLDKLRRTLNADERFETYQMKAGEHTPIVKTMNHTHDELLKYHEELSNLHREHEQKVNYYKAKLKNMANDENIKIAQENQAKARVYGDEFKQWSEKRNERQSELYALISPLRIGIPTLFQSTIDLFKEKIKGE